MNRKLLLLVAILVALAGCETVDKPFSAVKFSSLPPSLGGGVGEKIILPGTKEILMPWETLYRIDVSEQSLSWGGRGEGDNPTVEDLVETRAKDGNEVSIAVTVQYKVDPEALPHIIQKVAISDERIRLLVASIARSDIRTHLNVLSTRDFIDVEELEKAALRVKDAMNARLQPEGIEVVAVIPGEYRFERRIPAAGGGQEKIDRSYQQQIEETQGVQQLVGKEKNKIKTVIQEKKAQFEQTQAKVNRAVEEAKGLKRAAEIEGDAYLKVKQNESEQILVKGNAEVEGLKQQIAALAGPGGKALLRLKLFKELIKNNPKFVLVDSEQGKGQVQLNQLDTNQLIEQAGVFKALGAKEK